jgi:fumarylacetoacetate (FAA) hydrolase family protein
MLDFLPADWQRALLIGRVDFGDGPTPVAIRSGTLFDLSEVAPTVARLLEKPADALGGRALGEIADFDFRPEWDEPRKMRLLAPVDLQCVKAAGVTFAISAMERVIEERARGDSGKAEAIRTALERHIGSSLRACRPGSPEASRLKDVFIADGLWSQYLEVAIGPDAEIFTKAPPLSSVGWGGEIGIRPDSIWNNPEPEIVLMTNRFGDTVGASLGNDVNLRDFEGRSALLLGKAKDNNASCSIGPFIRLFDEHYTLDNVRNAEIELTVAGADNYRLEGKSSMNQISRDPLDLVRQTVSQHQYPDGFALFLGTMFAPVQDRDVSGLGFTHKLGDVVQVSTPRLGKLKNKVTHCNLAAPWNFGITDLMHNLARRGLLKA